MPMLQYEYNVRVKKIFKALLLRKLILIFKHIPPTQTHVRSNLRPVKIAKCRSITIKEGYHFD